MKPCEFEGWIELEPQDIIMRGDTWGSRAGTDHPIDDVASTFRIGRRLVDQNIGGYRLFRKSNARPARKLYVCKCQPLPLP